MVELVKIPEGKKVEGTCESCKSLLRFSKEDVFIGHIHCMFRAEPLIKCPNCGEQLSIPDEKLSQIGFKNYWR